MSLSDAGTITTALEPITMSDDFKIEGMSAETAMLVLANEQRHTSKAIERLIKELKEHREAVDNRVNDMDARIQEHERRLTTMETTAKTGASVADWVWRVAPVIVMAIFAIATFMSDQKHVAKAVASQPPAIVQQISPRP